MSRVSHDHYTHKLMEIGLRLGKISESGDVAATFDAGKINYFSPIPVINLDGLANSYEYLKNVRSTGLYKEYFDEMGVTYFLARDVLLDDFDAVRQGTCHQAVFKYDPRIVFRDEDEVFRVFTDEGFLVVAFRYEPTRSD